MDINLRMEANAIIERMTEFDGEHFDHGDAERLIAIIPMDRKPPRFTTIFSRESKSDSTEGYAAGVGNVSIPGGEEGERADTVLVGGHKVWKVGGYEVEHVKGKLTIRKMWARDALGTADQEAILDYTSSPIKLRVMRMKTISILNLEIGYATWPIWKTAR
ncbi:hypothetical protein [Microvirga terricola]|uniref:Uncharacterized protein n=1 Tax=Microvirga terricola TaxID=2719797 RepID=A0ABX0VE02_9HYPH|nr:hypothetical protein [Microvirga terricola]NIX77376.1 hypothetical protein [Microvirga terricola]